MHSYEINSNEALPIPRAKKPPNALSLKTLPIQNILASAWLLGKKEGKIILRFIAVLALFSLEK
jgi:hypothetical protein